MIRKLDHKTLVIGMQHLQKVDKDLSKIIKKNKNSIKLYKRSPGFMGLINLIVEQQLSVTSAKAIFKRINDCLPKFNENNFFNLSNEKLKEAGLSKQKILYSKGIAKAAINKKLNFRSLNSLKDEDVVSFLTSFKGVGEWTAHCYLLGCLGRTDAWPSSDLGLQIAVEKIKNLKKRPKKLTMEKIAEPWKPFRSVAALLLWSTYD